MLSLAMLSQSAGFDSKTWMYMGAKIHVTVGKKESGSIGSYLVSVVAPGGKRGTVRADRDGSLVGAWAADIDGDKKLEVIVATQSAGNGSYGKAGVFSWTGSSLKAKVVPELNRTQLNGYRGHDTFSVSRNTLYRSFPVYTQKGNSPAKKVGTRTLKLNLKKFRWESA
ncbi:MAG: hypothetical protein BGO01_11075 [Armatimonadetes bacterium 55-13]|nr:MAG: hypothetical protein BGO01_11075 [Armatimonadetes bacterium 55-13]